MARYIYLLGEHSFIDRLYPPVKFVTGPDPRPQTQADVIAHFTNGSLALDRIPGTEGGAWATSSVDSSNGAYEVTIAHSDDSGRIVRQFAAAHQRIMSAEIGGKAAAGEDFAKALGVWNPMAGHPVNSNPEDGDCKWNLFLPLGLGMVNQKAVTLLHYPPWQALVEANYLNNITLHRWQDILQHIEIPKDQIDFFKTMVDVNPIAGPGSGQSEYPNDFFPAMMTQIFFDGDDGRDYLRSMLELLLNPPHNADNPYTLPLLIGGSPLYDPQGPLWFKAAFKDVVPAGNPRNKSKKNDPPIPQSYVGMAGKVKLRPNSEKYTPYMIANHMIAAGVTGKCTDDPAEIPDIRKYEAQDLVAASFLQSYAEHPDQEPEQVAKLCCERWFGAPDGFGKPNPADPADRELICILAQRDLFFSPTPLPHAKFKWEEARDRCRRAAKHSNDGLPNPCDPLIAPGDNSG
jgi:hypothetical protein